MNDKSCRNKVLVFIKLLQLKQFNFRIQNLAVRLFARLSKTLTLTKICFRLIDLLEFGCL
jgi:hypothetical protein